MNIEQGSQSKEVTLDLIKELIDSKREEYSDPNNYPVEVDLAIQSLDNIFTEMRSGVLYTEAYLKQRDTLYNSTWEGSQKDAAWAKLRGWVQESLLKL